MNRFLFTTLIVCGMSFIWGCSDGEKYVPVSGIVTMDGKPLTNASLLFEPLSQGEDLPPGKPSVGKTDGNGKFQLHSPLGKREGATPGQHRVRILTSNNKPVYSEKQIEDARKRLMAQAKADGVENPTVTDEKVLAYLSEVMPIYPEERIPKRYNQQSELTFIVPESGSTEANFNIQSR